MRRIWLVALNAGLGIALTSVGARAGSLDSPADPTSTNSAMFSLEDVYDRLNTGAAGARRAGPFREPSAGPGNSGHTLDEIMGKTPAIDSAQGATVGEVLAGRTFWGLTSNQWARQTGTMSNRGAVVVTPSTAQQSIAQGYHNGAGYVAGDADLVTGNIKSGINIFGVAGSTAVVDTSAGTALAGDLLSGRTAWLAGSVLTGTMASNAATVITPGTNAQSIAQGYHNGTGSVAGDTDLVTGNIKSGINIFGVAGKTEVVDTTTGDATTNDLMSGKKAWVDGVEVSGSIQTRTLSAVTSAVQDGYYAATNLIQIDSDLTSGNVRGGVIIFGVTGSVYAPVAKTGVTNTYSTPGSDGDLKAGVTPPATRFTEGASGDATNLVTDNLTGLMWYRNANLANSASNWASAVDFCNNLTNNGYSDWRLPNVRELMSLLDFSQSSPMLPTNYLQHFNNVQPSAYWTSTTYASDSASAYELNVGGGSTPLRPQGKSNSKFMWPVRGPQ